MKVSVITRLMGLLIMKEKEIWKDVIGYEGYYKVSDYGRVKSLNRIIVTKREVRRNIPERILVNYLNGCGYPNVGLTRRCKTIMYSVHSILMKAFVPTTISGVEVNHIDGNPLNNKLDNLEWVSHAENMAHAGRIGLMPHGINHCHAKISMDMGGEIKNRYALGGVSTRTLAKEYGVNYVTIWEVVTGKHWTTRN